MLTKKLLGEVGVDSGQLMVMDPCYIKDEWKDTEFKDIRAYEHKTIYDLKGDKQMFIYTTEDIIKDKKVERFENFDSITSTGKSMNQMLQEKEVVEVEVPSKDELIGTLSYGGICETTINDQHQINYKLGHPGAAVVFNSGYGDGCYKVYGYFNEEGRCMMVEVDMGITKQQQELIDKMTDKIKE